MPLKAWVKSALDQVIQVCLKEPELEFAWVGDDAVDPLQQAQTLSLLVGAGIKTREEARAELGLAGAAKRVAKYNHNHDERGRFTTPEGAGNGAGSTSEAPDQAPAPAVATSPRIDPVPAFAPAVPTAAATAASASEAWLRAAARLLAPLAADVTGPLIIVGALLVPSSNGIVEEGPIPGRPDLSYRWAHDEATVTYRVLIDGQWRTLVEAREDTNGVFRDSRGEAIAVQVRGPESNSILVTDLSALDRAVAAMGGGATSSSDSDPQTGLHQIYVNPQTGQTLLVRAGTDPSKLPPGFVPAGSDEDPENRRLDGNSPPDKPKPDRPKWTPPPEAVDKVPPDWGPAIPTKDGKGWRWFDPKGPKFGGIRMDPGNPNSDWPSQRVDHVIIRFRGVVLDGNGKAINGRVKDDAINAHIPLDDWLKWKDWNKP